MTIPKKIDLTPEELEAFLKRVSEHKLEDKDYEIINGMAETIKFLSLAVEEKNVSISRLLRRIFGIKTESSKNLIKEEEKGDNDNEKPEGQAGGSSPDAQCKTAGEPDNDSNKQDPAGIKSEKNNNGHGKNGASSYTGAQKISVKCPMNPGDPCPACPKGKLYQLPNPGVVVRLVGNVPVTGTVYKLEKLRCNLCGMIFTAELPKEAGEETYAPSVGVTIGLLKYGNGTPFYRQEGLQRDAGVPLPASTQWDLVEKTANKIYPAFIELEKQGAQAEILHNDDTNMKILDLIKKIREEGLKRTGLFTTGIIAVNNNIKIALFKTGPKHAGENLYEILKQRDKNLPPPIQMCDALSRNMPPELKAIFANCLTHGRRNFTDEIKSFPEECQYVVETLAKIYKYDQDTKDMELSPYDRLIYHQENSAPVMDSFKDWLNARFEEKKAEPNSGLGGAISYMLKHWEPLTLFLRKENAPLDNNICEQALKRAILHRKNSLFYKTQHGAYIGDVFMSLIHTCRLNKINPFDYLMTLTKYSSELFKNPHLWMPWNYKASVLSLSLP